MLNKKDDDGDIESKEAKKVEERSKKAEAKKH